MTCVSVWLWNLYSSFVSLTAYTVEVKSRGSFKSIITTQLICLQKPQSSIYLNFFFQAILLQSSTKIHVLFANLKNLYRIHNQNNITFFFISLKTNNLLNYYIKILHDSTTPKNKQTKNHNLSWVLIQTQYIVQYLKAFHDYISRKNTKTYSQKLIENVYNSISVNTAAL